MFNLGPFELLAIFVVALLVFGPDKLPEMGRQVGKAVREFKKFQASMETNVRDVLDPITGPIMNNGPVGPPPTNVRDTGTIAAEAAGNVPKSATIQDSGEGEGEGKGEDGGEEQAAAPGSFGSYAPIETVTPQNGPAPDNESSSSGEAAPPERPADPDSR
jgi:TatA/E family protein of Tat protein translocase